MYGKICMLKIIFYGLYWVIDCYENQNIHKRNDCKVYLCFVNCCFLVIILSTKGYQIIYYFSRLSRSVSCHFIMSRMYIRKTSWEQD